MVSDICFFFVDKPFTLLHPVVCVLCVLSTLRSVLWVGKEGRRVTPVGGELRILALHTTWHQNTAALRDTVLLLLPTKFTCIYHLDATRLRLCFKHFHLLCTPDMSLYFANRLIWLRNPQAWITNPFIKTVNCNIMFYVALGLTVCTVQTCCQFTNSMAIMARGEARYGCCRGPTCQGPPWLAKWRTNQ